MSGIGRQLRALAWAAMTCTLVLACEEPLLHRSASVRLSSCGDGLLQGNEQCDAGVANDDRAPDACRTNCERAHCGDGVTDTGEECDDGNTADGDGCNNDCTAWLWSTSFGVDATGLKIATDDHGDIFTTGWEQVDATDSDIWVHRYTPEGELVWRRTFNGPFNGLDAGSGIAVDANGIVVVGQMETGPGLLQAWVARLSAEDGTELWTRTFEYRDISERQSAYDPILLATNTALDPDGNIIVAVTAYQTAISLAIAGVLKLDPAGALVWARPFFAATNWIDARAVAADRSGNIAVTGQYYSWDTFKTWTRKYGPDGTVLWTRFHGAGLSRCGDSGSGVAFDPDGYLVTVGWECVPPNDNPSQRSWIRKYSRLGTELWTETRQSPGDGPSQGMDAVIDSSGALFVTGFESVPGQAENGWTAKFDAAGHQLWTRTFDGPAHDADYATSVALDPLGNVLVLGVQTPDSTNEGSVWLRKYMP